MADLQRIWCPEYDRAIDGLMDDLMRGLMAANDSFLGQVRQTTVDNLPDGDADPDAAIGVSHKIDVEASFTISHEMILAGDIDAWATVVFEAAQQSLASMMPQLFEGMDAAIRKGGGVVDASGKPLDWDVVLDAFETVEFDFDASGAPKKKTLVMSPANAERLRNIQFTEAQQARYAEIIAQKKADFDARRRVRQLD